MATPETPISPLARAQELANQFADHKGGCTKLQKDMRAALEGTCAEAIFGDQRVSLLERVNRMNDADLTGVNATIHLFSKALLNRLDEFTSHSIEGLTQSLKTEAGAAA